MKLNVYGEELQQCQRERNLKDGAMQKDGTCSEPGGGVHQICTGGTLFARFVGIPCAGILRIRSPTEWSAGAF